MNLHEEIKKGLNEAIKYEKGKIKAKTTAISTDDEQNETVSKPKTAKQDTKTD